MEKDIVFILHPWDIIATNPPKGNIRVPMSHVVSLKYVGKNNYHIEYTSETMLFPMDYRITIECFNAIFTLLDNYNWNYETTRCA